ncbi:MAG: DNA polymerase III subunit gamma/tau [Erysipelotrichaceae bacterium]|nr:DNA polymerase III subunit gamma/tau [Erysipelotrichaceae bacterium]
MAYKALYRMYRPDSFDDVAGQKYIVKTLQNAIQQNKIAHAYLFCGPRGTGKTSMAKIFAKAINCANKDHKPCLECDSCKAIKNNAHPDIIEIDAASNNGVEEVRNLIEKVKYAPIEGKYKVYIIDEVHMMSTGAFNALLKTIEEPPSHVIFILATTEPHKVLPTIISRCQRYDFMKVPPSDIEKRVSKVLEMENIQCDQEVIQIVAQLCDGGMRDALSIMDQCVAYAQDHIKIEHIHAIYGIMTAEEKIKILNTVITKDVFSLLEILHNIKEKGIDVKRLTMDLIEILKESILYSYTKDMRLIKQLTQEEIENLSTGVDMQERFSMIDILINTYDKYKFASNVVSYFEVALLKMMNKQEKNENIDIENLAVNTQNNYQNVSRETSSYTQQPIEKTILNQEKVSYSNESVEEVEDIPLLDEEEKEEIIETKLEEDGIKPLDDTFILSLLVGANKTEKIKDIQSFQSISEYISDLDWAKQANNLKSAEILASSDKYLVLVFSNQAEANAINEKETNDECYKFTHVLWKQYKKIFAISVEQKNRVIQDFKVKRDTNSLPEPYKMESIEQEKEEEVVEVKTEEQAILELFGEENIVITEEEL